MRLKEKDLSIEIDFSPGRIEIACRVPRISTGLKTFNMSDLWQNYTRRNIQFFGDILEPLDHFLRGMPQQRRSLISSCS